MSPCDSPIWGGIAATSRLTSVTDLFSETRHQSGPDVRIGDVRPQAPTGRPGGRLPERGSL
jgi:hypothetical protein